jgi:hypothetical protein
MPANRRIDWATPHPCPRRKQGGSAPLIKYPPVLRLFKMPQKYAPFVAYKADRAGRGRAATPPILLLTVRKGVVTNERPAL